MADMDEKGLKAHIKKGDFFPAYLFVGDEAYLKKHYSDLLVSKIVDESFESFNLNKFEGKNISLSEVFDSCELMPMMSDKRCGFILSFTSSLPHHSPSPNLKEKRLQD